MKITQARNHPDTILPMVTQTYTETLYSKVNSAIITSSIRFKLHLKLKNVIEVSR